MKYGQTKPHLFYKDGLWRVVQLGHLTSFGGNPSKAYQSFKYYNQVNVLRYK
jgi:hypothetical protein